MKAKQVAKLMAQYLGQKELLSTTTLDGQQSPTTDQSEILATYLTCINDVVQTLATSYFPLNKKQQLESQNKVFSYSLFSKPLLQIVWVKDLKLDNKIRFNSFVDGFEADSTFIEVLYSYQPEFCQSFGDDLEVSLDCVTPRLVALGAVARYYLFEGLHKESEAWNRLFERAVLVASRPKRSLYIQKRSWF